MVRLPRPLFLVAFTGALLASGCAHHDTRVQRVDISYQLCDGGCHAFETSFTKHRSSASPAFEAPGDLVRTGKTIAEALNALPLDAVERCSHAGNATNLDHVQVGIHFRDGTDAFCMVTASGPAGNANDAERVRLYARFFGWPIYRATLAPQYRILASAVKSNRVRWLEINRTGCYGSCPIYDARFDLDGNAVIVRLTHQRWSTIRIPVPFESVRHALIASNLDALLPGYPSIAEDTPGATITLGLTDHRFVIRATDAASWDSSMAVLIARLDQIVTDFTPPTRVLPRHTRHRATGDRRHRPGGGTSSNGGIFLRRRS